MTAHGLEEGTPCWLVAEDNDDDFFLLRRACSKLNAPLRICRCTDGEEAISYLLGEGIYHDREAYPLPNLILSDLKMPRYDGLELLRWVKTQPALTDVPFLLMSASPLDRDRGRAQDLGADDYLLKPGSASDLLPILASVLEHYSKSGAAAPCR